LLQLDLFNIFLEEEHFESDLCYVSDEGITIIEFSFSNIVVDVSEDF